MLELEGLLASGGGGLEERAPAWRPDHRRPDAWRDRVGGEPDPVLGARRADHLSRDRALGDRDAVDVARAGEDPAALGTR